MPYKKNWPDGHLWTAFIHGRDVLDLLEAEVGRRPEGDVGQEAAGVNESLANLVVLQKEEKFKLRANKSVLAVADSSKSDQPENKIYFWRKVRALLRCI